MKKLNIDPKKVLDERKKRNRKILRHLKTKGLSILDDVDILGCPNPPHPQTSHYNQSPIME
jgi:hypothetical protein